MKYTKRALLLGANGGAGRATAAKLRADGYQVIAACRKAEQGEQLLADALADSYVLLTLDSDDSIQAAVAELASSGIQSLTALVNCAAVTWPAPLELSDIKKVRQCFETNVFGPLLLIQEMLPLLRKGNGRIVFVSSTSGTMGVPLLGAYASSKHALEGMMDVLRRELAEWQMPVSLIIPAGIKTPMIGQQYEAIDSAVAALKTPLEQAYKNQYLKHRRLIEIAERTAVSPDVVADYVLKALSAKRPKARYYCGLAVHGGSSITGSLPDSVMDQLFELLPPSRNSGNQA